MQGTQKFLCWGYCGTYHSNPCGWCTNNAENICKILVGGVRRLQKTSLKSFVGGVPEIQIISLKSLWEVYHKYKISLKSLWVVYQEYAKNVTKIPVGGVPEIQKISIKSLREVYQNYRKYR